MAKSKNHTAHNQSYKAHKNGIKKPKRYRHTSTRGEEDGKLKKKKGGLKLKINVKNPSLRRLISGGIVGAVSRTCVAPLETIRAHLMVGSSGHTTTEVFRDIMKTNGWTGLFRGNLVNVIRVAPSKAIEAMNSFIGIMLIELIDAAFL